MNKKQEKFRKLPAAQKRIAIAKDVLLQLRSRTIKAESGIYFHTVNYDFFTKNWDNQFDEVFSKMKKANKKKPVCEVCGIGGLAVSAALCGNKVLACDIDVESTMRKVLLRYFPLKQVAFVECAFEKSTMGTNVYPNISMEDRELAASMYYKIESDTTRLKRIMQNIIDNNGTFVIDRKIKNQFTGSFK